MKQRLPGLNEINQAIESIAQASLPLQGGKFPHAAGQIYQTLQANLSASASSLNMSSSEGISFVRGTPNQQEASAGNFSGQFEELLKAGTVLASTSNDRQIWDDMLGHMRHVSITSSRLLLAKKALAVDPNACNMQNQLVSADKGIIDAIDLLLNMCQSHGPGQRECALRNIKGTVPWLDKPNEPVSGLSYIDCMETVTKKSMALGELGAQINSTTRKGDFDQNGTVVANMDRAVCQLAGAAMQAACLVCMAGPGGGVDVPGLVDHAWFPHTQRAVTLACQGLLKLGSAQIGVVTAADFGCSYCNC